MAKIILMRPGRYSRFFLAVILLVTAPSASALFAQAGGRIKGRVLQKDGRAAVGVRVGVEGGASSDVTDRDGTFVLKRVPPGTHTLVFTFRGKEVRRPDVVVTSGEEAAVEQVVDWDTGFVEAETVYSASRHAEPKAEAPSAVTLVTEEEIARQAAHGQVPKLLEFTPGAEITQSEVEDFNFNTRGFNDTVNGRVEVLLDGREMNDEFFSSVFWSLSASDLGDFERVEFLRGPSSALYGSNAWSGVVNLVTKEPRDSQGLTARLTAGELGTTNGDVRYAGELGKGWYFKVSGGARDSGNFHFARTDSTEYSSLCPMVANPFLDLRDCLVQEIPPRLGGTQIRYGSARLDKYLPGEGLLTIEGGTASNKGTIIHGGVGRVQILGQDRPWARLAYSNERWNLMAAWDEHRGNTLNLFGGAQGSKPGDRYQFDAQRLWALPGAGVHLVAGGSYKTQTGEKDPRTQKKVDLDMSGVFGQVDWDVNDHLKLVAAARWDNASFHDAQISPKAAVVYRFNPLHSVRLTYNEAFRRSGLFGYFTNSPPIGPLRNLEAAFCDSGPNPDCGLAAVPLVFVGNRDLELEKDRTVELGYTGLFGSKLIITVDVYHNDIDNFVYQNLLPQVGTSLGKIATDFGPWVGTPDAENTLINPADCPVPAFPAGTTYADCVRAAVPGLSNRADGSSVLVGASFANLGKVSSQGADVALEYLPTRAWHANLSYSFFDADLEETLPGLEELFTPNTPRHKYSVGAGYTGRRLDASLSYRWVDGFRWVGGIYKGEVPTYSTADLNAGYDLGRGWNVRAYVANLFDREHYEAFGGSLIGRRALASVTYSWK